VKKEGTGRVDFQPAHLRDRRGLPGAEEAGLRGEKIRGGGIR